MRSLLALCLLLLCTIHDTFAQKNIDEIQTSYANYFQDTREIPFLHLNKTSFLNGEEIWFKAYVVEQNSMKLHATTSNLYVSIFEESGKLKDQQLINIDKGKGYGSILLDSTFIGKNYYIKASTSWMKNFDEDQSFSQKIKIVAGNKSKKGKAISEKDFFQLNLFPEGGEFVANALNNIGILAKDSNEERLKVIKGLIKNREGKLLKEFTTNNLGLGSVRLFLEEKEQYQFEATLENGSVVTKTIFANSLSTLGLWVENKKNNLVVHIQTNAKYLEKNAGKKYKIWVHNTSKFLQHHLTLNAEMQNYAVIIKKKVLPAGMNIVTIFDENNKALAERLLFINRKNLYSDVSIQVHETTTDSLTITLKNPTQEKLFLSASFLPNGTKAYDPKNSMVSSTLIQPHINGQVDKEVYTHLSDVNKNSENINISLITKGWSKYNWNNIFTRPPQLNYSFEQGIDMTIHVNKKLRKDHALLVYSPENDLLHTISREHLPFVIKSTSITKDTEISFGLRQGERVLKITPAINYSNSKLYDNFRNYEKPVEVNEVELTNFPTLTSDVEKLDEVVVKATKSEIPKMSRHLRKIEMKSVTMQSGRLLDYLKLVIPPHKSYLFFADGEQQRGMFGWALLESTYMDEIKELYIGGSIFQSRLLEVHIYTFSPKEQIEKRRQFTKVKLPVGFASVKEYYSPKYPISNIHFTHYGALFWKPDITIEPNTSITLTIPTNLQKGVNVYIEGISESGKLISKQEIINLKP